VVLRTGGGQPHERAWEQARQDDRYYYDEEVARTALKIMDSRARLSMAPGYLNGD
jgi:hypothetical protein